MNTSLKHNGCDQIPTPITGDKIDALLLADGLNFVTVLQTATPPSKHNCPKEILFAATLSGIIWKIGQGEKTVFLDITSKVWQASGESDRRGLIGLAFHHDFSINGLFYLYYTVAGITGTTPKTVPTDPCVASTLCQSWTDRCTDFDHINTVEEWIYSHKKPKYVKTLLSLRCPFATDFGVNNLHWASDSDNLLLTTSDGGHGIGNIDPFNLSQNQDSLLGKIIGVTVNKSSKYYRNTCKGITTFSELTKYQKRYIHLLGKGLRNPVAFEQIQLDCQPPINILANTGDVSDGIYAFQNYPVNTGSRGWDGTIPTQLSTPCPDTSYSHKLAFFADIQNLPNYYRPYAVFWSNSLVEGIPSARYVTGTQFYAGSDLPLQLQGKLISSLFQYISLLPITTGILAYSSPDPNDLQKITQPGFIKVYFPNQKTAYFTCLGSDSDRQTLYLATTSQLSVEGETAAIYKLVA